MGVEAVYICILKLTIYICIKIKKIALIVGSGFCNAKSAISCKGPHSPSQSSFGTSRSAPLPTQQRSPAHIQTTFLSKFEPIPVLFLENVSPQNFLVMIWPIIIHVSSSLEPEDPKINTVALLMKIFLKRCELSKSYILMLIKSLQLKKSP